MRSGFRGHLLPGSNAIRTSPSLPQLMMQGTVKSIIWLFAPCLQQIGPSAHTSSPGRASPAAGADRRPRARPQPSRMHPRPPRARRTVAVAAVAAVGVPSGGSSSAGSLREAIHINLIVSGSLSGPQREVRVAQTVLIWCIWEMMHAPFEHAS